MRLQSFISCGFGLLACWALAACGGGSSASSGSGGSSSEAGSGAGGTAGTGPGGSITRGGGGGTSGAAGCVDEAKLIYLIDQEAKLFSFDPTTLKATLVGPLDCDMGLG